MASRCRRSPVCRAARWTLDAGSLRTSQRPRFEEIFTFLAARGLSRSSLQLAWDFQTGSDGTTSTRLLRMRDAAFAFKPPAGSPALLVIDKTLERPTTRPELLRQLFWPPARPVVSCR